MCNNKKVQKRIESVAEVTMIVTSDEGDKEGEGITFGEMTFSISKNAPDKLIGADEKTFNVVTICLRAASIACAIYTILAVELTIKWNGINGVYTIRTTGQPIPFVIGVIRLCKALHDVNFKFQARFFFPTFDE